MTPESDPVKSGKKLLAKAGRAGVIVYQQGPELMMEGPPVLIAQMAQGVRLSHSFRNNERPPAIASGAVPKAATC